MKSDIELLSAYLDDELESHKATDLEARLEAEPELQRKLDDLRSQDMLVVASVRQIDKVPLPSSLETLLMSESSANANMTSDMHRPLKGFLAKLWVQPATTWIAACSALFAVFFSFKVMKQGPQLTLEALTSTGEIQSTTLNAFLSNRLTGSTLDQAGLKVSQQMAYADQTNALCKYYLTNTQSASYHSIACYNNSRWDNHFVYAENLEPGRIDTNVFIPANDTLNDIVENYLEANIPEHPLTKTEETNFLRRMGLLKK